MEATPKMPAKRLIKQQQSTRPGRGFSWLIAMLLLLCLLINYMDRQSLAVLVGFLPPALKMNNITYGQIQGLFLLSYALAMPLAGWAIDRLGVYRGCVVHD